jgi:NAD-dependent dihydropyrimidine dehydrogenase PreA subunit
MPDNKVWVDQEKCTGCGACIAACQSAAIAPVDGHVQVDLVRCNGCGACIGACQESALQPLLEGEIVTVDAPTWPVVRERSAPLTRVRDGALLTVGAGLVTTIVRGLGWVLDRWAPPKSTTRCSLDEAGISGSSNAGRRARRRRRGG